MTRARLVAGASVVVILAAVGLAFYLYQDRRASQGMEKKAQIEGDVITVFVPREGGKLQRKLVEVHRQPSDAARAGVLFRELKEARCIPDRLKMYDMALGSDGVLYLNVSEEFIGLSSPEREISMTYGIVDSFIESFHNVKKVQILVEGQPVYTGSGVLYLFSPLEFNRELVED